MGFHRDFHFTFGSKHLRKGIHSCFCLTHTGKFFVELIFRIIFWKIFFAKDLLFKNNLLLSRFQGIHINLQFQKSPIRMVVLLEGDKLLFFCILPKKGHVALDAGRMHLHGFFLHLSDFNKIIVILSNPGRTMYACKISLHLTSIILQITSPTMAMI
jgi:hypothetical protein